MNCGRRKAMLPFESAKSVSFELLALRFATLM